jgi:hypothetical protein
MRDIRTDLRERLEDLERQRAELTSKLEDLDAQRVTVGALLDAEQKRFGDAVISHDDGTATVFQMKPVHNLARLMRQFLADGSRLSTQRLAELAVSSGYPFGDKAPGRAVHFGLVGLQRGGHVTRSGDGTWCLANGEGRAP